MEKQTETWGTVENDWKWSTKVFFFLSLLLLKNQIYCWNLMWLLYIFTMKPDSLLDGGAAIHQETAHSCCTCLSSPATLCRYGSIRRLLTCTAALSVEREREKKQIITGITGFFFCLKENRIWFDSHRYSCVGPSLWAFQISWPSCRLCIQDIEGGLGLIYSKTTRSTDRREIHFHPWPFFLLPFVLLTTGAQLCPDGERTHTLSVSRLRALVLNVTSISSCTRFPHRSSPGSVMFFMLAARSLYFVTCLWFPVTICSLLLDHQMFINYRVWSKYGRSQKVYLQFSPRIMCALFLLSFSCGHWRFFLHFRRFLYLDQTLSDRDLVRPRLCLVTAGASGYKAPIRTLHEISSALFFFWSFERQNAPYVIHDLCRGSAHNMRSNFFFLTWETINWKTERKRES